MIISCINCNKKFDIDGALIPVKGRLLQCNNCKHRWFFKNDIIPELIETIKSDNLEVLEKDNTKEKKLLANDINDKIKNSVDNIINEEEVRLVKNKKKINFSNLTIIFIISFISFIILIDTFKNPISKFFPSIEFLLYNLYESIKDILLFFKDLI